MTNKNMKHQKWCRYEPLDSKVLAVAIEGEVGDWTAYIGAVAGENHEKEYLEVLRYGTKLYYSIARILFPDFAKNFTWRP